MIGVLGGTFDPVHYGHLRTALEVQQALGLEQVRLIPLRDPPHRRAPRATPEQRLNMLRLAVGKDPLLQVDDRELKRGGKSYTLDTLRSLHSELGQTTLCLLLGSDAFRGFPDWHQPEKILQLAHLVVVHRPGDRIAQFYPERWCRQPGELHAGNAGRLLAQPITQLDISASAIRAQLRSGASPRYLLPDPVLELIQRQRIYR